MLYDVLVIGGGPAGCTAGLYAARSGLRCAILAGNPAEGQLTTALRIDNYPGVPGAEGALLAGVMRRQAETAGAQVIDRRATAVRLSGEGKMVYAGDTAYQARSVIAATGAAARHLGLPGEERLAGRGVSYCAACDAMFFRGKRVAVVGGGNTAVREALLLCKLCSEVHLIHRRDVLRAAKAEQAALAGMQNLHFHWNTQVRALLGDAFLEGLSLGNTITGEERQISVSGVFIAVGVQPQSALFRDVLPMDTEGFLRTDIGLSTAVDGVFAAGDVRSGAIHQIITAAADGAAAAISVERYLNEGGHFAKYVV